MSRNNYGNEVPLCINNFCNILLLGDRNINLYEWMEIILSCN
jgi:hypothetical protein